METNQRFATDLPVEYTLPVSTIMTVQTWSASIDDTLAEVENTMAKRKLTSVPIMDSKGTIYGIVNWRDLMRYRASRTSLHSLQAWEICSCKPLVVAPDLPIHAVAKMMLELETPDAIVMEDGCIKGFVSTYDFVQRLLKQE